MLFVAALLAHLAEHASCTPDAATATLPEALVDDSECGLPGAEDQPECAMHALQFKAKGGSVDLDSEEGADFIEANREWYAAYIQEAAVAKSTYNHSMYEATTTSARHGVPPPRTAVEYNGMTWPEMVVQPGPNREVHFFALGDWGGMDGELGASDGFPRMLMYKGGEEHGPHIFAKSRLGCDMGPMNKCFNGHNCNPSCGFARGVDDQAQLLIAAHFKKRAAIHDPALILNVGDNFYWGGIAKKCGFPMNQIHPATQHQFDSIFEEVYSGPGIDGKPWLSVLGNHDWGGRQFNAGWDQQIAYTWKSNRWVMPALYYHQRVTVQNAFTVDIFMLDTNHQDAASQLAERAHNICGAFFNKDGASCGETGGPEDVNSCLGWFKSLWGEQQDWVEAKLSQSDADWQIINTHFPCDEDHKYWRKLHEEHGLDLLVTGHRHQQELWKANSKGWRKGVLGGLTCFVTGGGGGVTSEESPLPHRGLSHFRPNVNTQYGFFDMTLSKEKIVLESIDYEGKVVDSTTVYPKSL